MTILVCDDDKEIVEAIEIYLMQEGYDVEKAYDGIQAVEIMPRSSSRIRRALPVSASTVCSSRPERPSRRNTISLS